MEWNGKKMENNGENSGPLTSLPVNRLTATDCNAAARAKMSQFVKIVGLSQNAYTQWMCTLEDVVLL